MMQENRAVSRILHVFNFWAAVGKRRESDLNKRKVRLRPFRILAVGLGAVTLIMLSKFPAKAVSLERQQAQLEAAASAYYDAQSRNNQLNTELSEINTSDFIERTARRDYGYCWYGETIYEVGNLDEIAQEFDVYGVD